MSNEVLLRGGVRLSVPSAVDVRALRLRLGMTQNLFAARFGFPLATLRHWEYGQRKPAGASLTLLNVIARNPRAVLQALRLPAGSRPVDELVGVWQASDARDRMLVEAAASDEREEREALATENERRRETALRKRRESARKQRLEEK